jgi:uncharacterized repeat protein (TIGR04076 family)
MMESINEFGLQIDVAFRDETSQSACAYIIKDGEGKVIDSKGFFLGEMSLNLAECTGLVKGLSSLQSLEIREINIYCPSESLVKQIIAQSSVISSDLQGVFEQIQRLLLFFDRWQIHSFGRGENREAGKIAGKILDEHGGESVPKEQEPNVIPKIMIEVLTSSEESICSAGMKRGQCFVVNEFVPSGLCLYAAKAILDIIFDVSHNIPLKEKIIRCSKPGCETMLKLSWLE